jgi:peptide/nickel transport system permease protein
MANYYIERTFQAILTIVVVASLSFGMIRLLPGGPMDFLRAQLAGQEGQLDRERLNTLIEIYTNVTPDQPLLAQYVEYMGSLMEGDLGFSVWYNEPVAQILGGAIPWTIFVMAIALTLTFTIGIGLGAVMAYAEGSKYDVSASVLSIVLNSIPYYVMAVVLVFVLGYQMEIFPTGGRMSQGVEPAFTVTFIQDALWHAVLPVFSFVLTGFGIQALSMRGNSIRVLGEDYLRVAKLRGLGRRTVAFRYIGRNAVLPLYTSIMISIGFMFGGSVILEQIFTYRGVGYYMFQAIDARDYPLMMGAFLLITIAVAIGVFVADLTYGKIDPRAGSGGDQRESF